MLDWEWYRDSNTKELFIHLLLLANHKEGRWEGQTVKRGQLITGRKSLATSLSLSEQQVRTSLSKLKSTSEITINSTNKFSLITINNYDLYNSANQQPNQQVTSNQPTSNQQVTTNNNDNNEKNEKKERGVSSKNWKKEYGEMYIQAFNKFFKTNYRLTRERERKLKERFKTFDSDQVALALVNLSESKFHQGQNDRGWRADPDFLIRSDEQVDKWLNCKEG